MPAELGGKGGCQTLRWRFLDAKRIIGVSWLREVRQEAAEGAGLAEDWLGWGRTQAPSVDGDDREQDRIPRNQRDPQRKCRGPEFPYGVAPQGVLSSAADAFAGRIFGTVPSTNQMPEIPVPI